MKLRTVKRLYKFLFLTAVIVAVAGYSILPLPVYLAVGMGLLVAMGILVQKFWRCPFCGGQLGKMNICPVVDCPHCGHKVEL